MANDSQSEVCSDLFLYEMIIKILTIRRRQHLYLYHALPDRCERCFTDFKTQSELQEHIYAENRCSRRDDPGRDGLDGFDKAQEVKLRGRKRKGSKEEKWNEIYRILFPGHLPIPWPCKQDDSYFLLIR